MAMATEEWIERHGQCLVADHAQYLVNSRTRAEKAEAELAECREKIKKELRAALTLLLADHAKQGCVGAQCLCMNARRFLEKPDA